MMNVYKIGTIVYAVHKLYVDKKMGAKIIPCKIIGYENIDDEIIPILKAINFKTEIGSAYTFYDDLNTAVQVIKTKPEVIRKKSKK